MATRIQFPFAQPVTFGPIVRSGRAKTASSTAFVGTVEKEKMLTTSKMLGGASQIVSTIRVICNGT